MGLGELEQNVDATVNADTTISVLYFDWDGHFANSQTTINTGRTLKLDVYRLDNNMSNVYQGTVVSHGGILDIASDLGSWIMSGRMVFDSSTPGEVRGDVISVNHGAIDVSSFAVGRIVAPAGMSDATVTIGVGGRLEVGATSYYGGSYTGLGELEQNGQATIRSDTRIEVATYDWDGAAENSVTQVNANRVLTLNVASLDDSDDQFDGTLNVDPLGRVEVNNGAHQWTLGGTIHLSSGAVAARPTCSSRKTPTSPELENYSSR